MNQEDKDLQDYYENLLEMFTTAGWKQYVEDITDNQEMLQDITTIADEKQFWHRRGQLEAVTRILQYETSIKNSYEDFTEDSNA